MSGSAVTEIWDDPEAADVARAKLDRFFDQREQREKIWLQFLAARAATKLIL